MWSLKLPTAGKDGVKVTKITPTPATIQAGDSRAITLSGPDLSTFTTVTLEGTDYKVTPNTKTKTGTFTIPMAVTAVAGHKEFTTGLDDDSANFQILVEGQPK